MRPSTAASRAESRQPSLRMEGSLPIQNPSGAAGITRGWTDRTAVLRVGGTGLIHGLTPHLSELSRAGMSPYGIAAELNGRRVSAVNAVPWDDNAVIFATNLMKILQPNWRDWRAVCPGVRL